MSRRIDRILGRGAEQVDRFRLEDLASQLSAQFTYGGNMYQTGGLGGSWAHNAQEPIGNSLEAYAQAAYKSNGIVFACIGVRMRLFSEVRFQWQDMTRGPGKLFGSPELAILETPWNGATTGDLLARKEQYASLGGNAYTYRNRRNGVLKVLRPDWVSSVLGARDTAPEDFDPNGLDSELAGFIYKPGGPGSQSAPVFLLPETVAHYAPIPDPEAQYRGMSWLTPVLTEIAADKAATEHKLKFFENAATPNIIVSYPNGVTPAQVREYVALMDENHAGVANAYRTLHFGAGADPKVVGADLKQLDFKVTQGAGETRIAAASGVAPIIAGFSEGLDAATYSNYGQARRAVGDALIRPLWRNVAGSLDQIVDTPNGARLWFDASDVSFLQEDEKDAADILYRDASTVRTLVDAGFKADSVKAAVKAGNIDLLEHSGLFSVQLQKAGDTAPSPAPVAP